MIELQLLESERVEANCGLNTVFYEGYIRTCLALPLHEQLRLINQRNEALRQVLQRK